MIDYGNPGRDTIPAFLQVPCMYPGVQITYLLYNAENHDVNVDIYQEIR